MEMVLELNKNEFNLIKQTIKNNINKYKFNRKFANLKVSFLDLTLQYNNDKEVLVKLNTQDARLLEAIMLDAQPQIGIGSDIHNYDKVANTIDDQTNFAEQDYLDKVNK